jgi:hypothetical protein
MTVDLVTCGRTTVSPDQSFGDYVASEKIYHIMSHGQIIENGKTKVLSAVTT